MNRIRGISAVSLLFAALAAPARESLPQLDATPKSIDELWAGYDPRAAVQVWQNMERESGNGTLEFLSTHPSPGRRSEEIAALLPQVMPIYQASPRRR